MHPLLHLEEKKTKYLNLAVSGVIGLFGMMAAIAVSILHISFFFSRVYSDSNIDL